MRCASASAAGSSRWRLNLLIVLLRRWRRSRSPCFRPVLPWLRCVAACFSAALSTGFCFEEVTRDAALRDFDSEMPGNQCDPTSRVLVNSAVCTEFRRRAPSQLENALTRTQIWRRRSLPADQIETLGRAETPVAQTKRRSKGRPRSRDSRPFDTEPSDGDAELKCSGGVVLECRLCVSKAFTRRLFVDRLESHRIASRSENTAQTPNPVHR